MMHGVMLLVAPVIAHGVNGIRIAFYEARHLTTRCNLRLTGSAS